MTEPILTRVMMLTKNPLSHEKINSDLFHFQSIKTDKYPTKTGIQRPLFSLNVCSRGSLWGLLVELLEKQRLLPLIWKWGYKFVDFCFLSFKTDKFPTKKGEEDLGFTYFFGQTDHLEGCCGWLKTKGCYRLSGRGYSWYNLENGQVFTARSGRGKHACACFGMVELETWVHYCWNIRTNWTTERRSTGANIYIS